MPDTAGEIKQQTKGNLKTPFVTVCKVSLLSKILTASILERTMCSCVRIRGLIG